MGEPPSENALPQVGVRRLKSRRKMGKAIELADDSRWEVPPGHEILTAHWTPETDITVVPGGYPEYPYDLINSESGDRVPARFCGIVRSPRGWRLIDS